MSRAILSVTQGPAMKLIEKKWIEGETICSEQSSTASSNSLTLDSFWDIFLITGAASISAFFITLCAFLYKNKHVLCDSSLSFLERLRAITRRFDERQLCHRTTKPNEGLPIGIGHAENSPPHMKLISPNANGGTTVEITEDDTHPQHFQPFDRRPLARTRWSMLYRAWRFRSRYARIMIITEVTAVTTPGY